MWDAQAGVPGMVRALEVPHAPSTYIKGPWPLRPFIPLSNPLLSGLAPLFGVAFAN
jgi:hypothetical protein